MAGKSALLRKILVASDLSDQSGLAIDRAAKLAREHEAEIIIVHVVDEDLPSEAQSYLTTTSDHDIRAKLARNSDAESLTKTIDIVVGRPDLDIAERAVAEEADLIVVGLHQRLLDENLDIQGTVAERIIQGTHLPVLVVKNQPRGPYKSVVVGVDFSAYSVEATQSAAIIAPDAILHLVHAYQSQPNLLVRFRDSEARARSAEHLHARMTSFIARQMATLEESAVAKLSKCPEVRHVYEPGEAHEVLKSQIIQTEADLVAVGTHGRIGLTRSILGSVSTEIMNDRLADVLVVRPY